MNENSYVVCSLHPANTIQQRQVINTAREIINLVKNQLKPQDGMSDFEIEIGVNTSPFVSGNSDQKKGIVHLDKFNRHSILNEIFSCPYHKQEFSTHLFSYFCSN
ncbi:MAG: hypothetical protein H7320_16005 [Ferruginibacter sp.]|nr:hypothetical protein [Ferruginibacter sp.]